MLNEFLLNFVDVPKCKPPQKLTLITPQKGETKAYKFSRLTRKLEDRPHTGKVVVYA